MMFDFEIYDTLLHSYDFLKNQNLSFPVMLL